jgi:hypothetical protein
MQIQKCESRKNYIGLLSSNETEDQRVTAEVQATAQYRIRHCVLGMMAAVFNRRSSDKL